MTKKKPNAYYTTLGELTDDLEILAAWKEDLDARPRRAEICFQSSVGLSDERGAELLNEGRTWKRACNATTDVVEDPLLLLRKRRP